VSELKTTTELIDMELEDRTRYFVQVSQARTPTQMLRLMTSEIEILIHHVKMERTISQLWKTLLDERTKK
tara:strand:- start:169 stop:378 length:210 start_codon:yes stop_codon:yes gene_type:complete